MIVGRFRKRGFVGYGEGRYGRAMNSYMVEKELTEEKIQDAIRGILNDDGFTIAIHDGSVPSVGFMVAVSKAYEKQVSDPGGFNREVITAYVDQYETELQPAARFLGGWVDNGLVYLDVVDHIAELMAAISAGKSRDQDAIFCLKYDGIGEFKNIRLKDAGKEPEKYRRDDELDAWVQKSLRKTAGFYKAEESASGGEKVRFFIGIDTEDRDDDGIADWIEMLLKGTLEGGLTGSEFSAEDKERLESGRSESSRRLDVGRMVFFNREDYK